MNDAPIGTYASTTVYASVPDDIYEATVAHAEVMMDKEDSRIPFTDKFGKNRLRVKFVLDEEVGPDNGPVELSRQFAISYGATGGTYAALASFIEAVLGLKCGDKAQRNVKPSELLNRKLRIQVKNVEKDDKTFCNVVGTFAPKAKAAPARAAAPAPASVKSPAARLGVDEDAFDALPDEDEIPF